VPVHQLYQLRCAGCDSRPRERVDAHTVPYNEVLSKVSGLPQSAVGRHGPHVQGDPWCVAEQDLSAQRQRPRELLPGGGPEPVATI